MKTTGPHTPFIGQSPVTRRRGLEPFVRLSAAQ